MKIGSPDNGAFLNDNVAKVTQITHKTSRTCLLQACFSHIPVAAGKRGYQKTSRSKEALERSFNCGLTVDFILSLENGPVLIRNTFIILINLNPY